MTRRISHRTVLGVLLRVRRLLPQPGGFEGREPLCELVHADDLAVADRVDVEEPSVDLDPASSTTSPAGGAPRPRDRPRRRTPRESPRTRPTRLSSAPGWPEPHRAPAPTPPQPGSKQCRELRIRAPFQGRPPRTSARSSGYPATSPTPPAPRLRGLRLGRSTSPISRYEAIPKCPDLCETASRPRWAAVPGLSHVGGGQCGPPDPPASTTSSMVDRPVLEAFGPLRQPPVGVIDPDPRPPNSGPPRSQAWWYPRRGRAWKYLHAIQAFQSTCDVLEATPGAQSRFSCDIARGSIHGFRVAAH